MGLTLAATATIAIGPESTYALEFVDFCQVSKPLAADRRPCRGLQKRLLTWNDFYAEVGHIESAGGADIAGASSWSTAIGAFGLGTFAVGGSTLLISAAADRDVLRPQIASAAMMGLGLALVGASLAVWPWSKLKKPEAVDYRFARAHNASLLRRLNMPHAPYRHALASKTSSAAPMPVELEAKLLRVGTYAERTRSIDGGTTQTARRGVFEGIDPEPLDWGEFFALVGRPELSGALRLSRIGLVASAVSGALFMAGGVGLGTVALVDDDASDGLFAAGLIAAALGTAMVAAAAQLFGWDPTPERIAELVGEYNERLVSGFLANRGVPDSRWQ